MSKHAYFGAIGLGGLLIGILLGLMLIVEPKQEVSINSQGFLGVEVTSGSQGSSVVSAGLLMDESSDRDTESETVNISAVRSKGIVEEPRLLEVLSTGIPRDPFGGTTAKDYGVVNLDPPIVPVQIDIHLKQKESQVTGSAGNVGKIQLPVWESDNKEIEYSNISGSIQLGREFGKLTSQRLGINNQVVRWGNQPEIDIGITQYSQFDLLGTAGVSMLCAHNYNPNWKIGNLQVGDRLFYETGYGKFVYEVYDAIVNNEGRDTLWLKDSYFRARSGDLLLMTCYPFDSDGSDGRRYLVFCKKISGPKVTDYPLTRIEKFGSFEKFIENK